MILAEVSNRALQNRDIANSTQNGELFIGRTVTWALETISFFDEYNHISTYKWGAETLGSAIGRNGVGMR